MKSLTVDESYRTLLSEIKTKIQHSQFKAVIAVNQQMLLLYWEIGNIISQRQANKGFGSKVVEQLSKDLKKTFPNMKGFSRRNLLYMRQFAEAYSKNEFVQQPVAQISWSHNILLLQKCSDKEVRFWYAQKALENGWSRNIMVMQIESHLYKRQGQSVTNFAKTLPSPQSELAQQIFKDPYILDFLHLEEDSLERELEDAIIKHIIKFLLALGKGFAFVGRQYHLDVEDEDFYLDLLFYHLELRCFVAIDLKTTKFKPEYAGKMNFYLAAIDDKVKKQYDNPSIGIILCKDKKNVVVEYALRGMPNPIGVSEFELTKVVPDNFQSKLPTIEELERELKGVKIDEEE